MSPEQARAEKVDHRSDLFSLGSVLYAMCVGHAPFRAESSYSILRLITDKEPRPIREINPDIPNWLCDIISTLMAKNADDRYQSAIEVADLLQTCLAHVQHPTAVRAPKILHTPRSNLLSGVSKPLTGVSKMVLSKFALIALTILGLVSAAFLVRPGHTSTEEMMEALYGEWQLESMTRSGVAVSVDQLFNERLIIETSQFARHQTKPDGQELQGESGRFSVGWNDGHKSIDFHLPEGTIYGIYELEGDKLLLCISKEGGQRPDSLATSTNDVRVLQRLVRIVKTPHATEVKSHANNSLALWLKKIPEDLPKDAAEAQKWMEENQFAEIRTGTLNSKVIAEINPDIKLEAYEQLGAKSFLFGELKSQPQFDANPKIEVYCFVNASNAIVGMQVTPSFFRNNQGK